MFWVLGLGSWERSPGGQGQGSPEGGAALGGLGSPRLRQRGPDPLALEPTEAAKPKAKAKAQKRGLSSPALQRSTSKPRNLETPDSTINLKANGLAFPKKLPCSASKLRLMRLRQHSQEEPAKPEPKAAAVRISELGSAFSLF